MEKRTNETGGDGSSMVAFALVCAVLASIAVFIIITFVPVNRAGSFNTVVEAHAVDRGYHLYDSIPLNEAVEPRGIVDLNARAPDGETVTLQVRWINDSDTPGKAFELYVSTDDKGGDWTRLD